VRKVDDLLQLFLNRIGQSEGAPYVGLFRGWRQIVGDRIADHAEPVDIRGTALVVEADHPGWVQMVLMSQAHILRQVNHRYPELTITGLHIRVSDDRAAAAAARQTTRADNRQNLPVDGSGPPGSGPPIPPPLVKPSADEKQALNRIDDTDLRSSLERLRRSLDADKETDKDPGQTREDGTDIV
jgi:hypothetical protein